MKKIKHLESNGYINQKVRFFFKFIYFCRVQKSSSSRNILFNFIVSQWFYHTFEQF